MGIATLISLIAIGAIGAWSQAMITLALVLTALLFCIVIGLPTGIWLARHDGRHCQRELNFKQHLPRAGTERTGGLNQIRRHLVNPEYCQTNNRRQGEDNGHHHARHVADTERSVSATCRAWW